MFDSYKNKMASLCSSPPERRQPDHWTLLEKCAMLITQSRLYNHGAAAAAMAMQIIHKHTRQVLDWQPTPPLLHYLQYTLQA